MNQEPIIHSLSDAHDAAVLLGRLGGSAKSPAKTAAVRVNGRKGGRPRKPCRFCGSTTHPPGCCAKDGHGG
jgi:hypothetical protein